jgi:hypothetical protein
MHVVFAEGVGVTAGVAPAQPSLLTGTARLCEGLVGDDSVWALLHRDGHRLFPDSMFEDLFADTGRRSVPPRIVATVMVLQRLFGLSDREAVEAFTFDARWKYACGGLDFDYPSFAHTVLVDMRARLARSARPNRIRDVTIAAAAEAGLVGAKRVLDSTPLYDAVATMDTITLIRSAMRGLFKAGVGTGVGAELRAVLSSGDDYANTAKPQIDWDDAEARQALIDSRAKDAMACLAVLDGRDLDVGMAEAATLVATVVGQDLERSEDGTFRIARRVAADRVISTVDPDARHGHKTIHRGFDGYKGHISIDPDSEIITASTVTAGNVADGTAAPDLLAEFASNDLRRERPLTPAQPTATIYGDAAYGSGPLLAHMSSAHLDANVKVQPTVNSGGRFPKDRFDVNLETDTVTCPAQITVPISWQRKGGIARFANACDACPLREQCTTSPSGRVINFTHHEAHLAAARARAADPARAADYRATRPKVERKLAHLVRRRHGGRRARVRGIPKVTADFNLLTAAANLARLATLGLRWNPTGWAIA